MMYIFPRQFSLHNVFTNDVDPRQTVQPFKDYTLREEEIKSRYLSENSPKVPKRLRGHAAQLVRRLQIQHSRCSYKKLLEHYCPVRLWRLRRLRRPLNSAQLTFQIDDPTTAFVLEPPESSEPAKYKTQISTSTLSMPPPPTSTNKIPARKQSLLDHATPTAKVSAFCRAVLSKLIPSGFWGSGEAGTDNQKIFHQNVDLFIELRRFESLSLHGVSQGLKVSFKVACGTRANFPRSQR